MSDQKVVYLSSRNLLYIYESKYEIQKVEYSMYKISAACIILQILMLFSQDFLADSLFFIKERKVVFNM